MAANEIKISIGGDISGLKTAARGATTAFDAIQKEANGVNTALENSSKEFGQFATKSAQSTQLARYAVLDLGHTIRDLPYALQNPALLTGPIDRVAQLFTEIQQQGGGAKAALASIGSVLAGSGGILIAFELVATAATFFFGHLVHGSQEAKQKTDDLKKSIRDLSIVQNEATGSVEGQIVKVNALAAAVLDETKTQEQRKRALDQLRDTNKAYFGDLTLESSKLKELTGRVSEYTQALVQQAIVKGFESEISKVAVSLSNARDETDKARTSYEQLQNQLSKTSQFSTNAVERNGAVQYVQTVAPAYAKLSNATEEAAKKFQDARDKSEQLGTQYALLSGKIDEAVKATLQFKSLDGPDSNKTKSNIDKIKEQFASLHSFVAVQLEATQQSIKEFQKSPFDIAGTFLVRNKIDLKNQPFGDVFQKDKEKIKQATDAMDKLKQKASEVQDVLISQLGTAFGDFFSGLISGSQNAFKAFTTAITQMIEKLIAAALEALVFSAIINAIFPGAGGVFGGGKGGFGSIFSQLTGLPKFAGGVTNFGGGLAIVGERGPELVKLPAGSDVIPNGASVGANISLMPSIAFSGDSFKIMLQKVDYKRGRLG